MNSELYFTLCVSDLQQKPIRNVNNESILKFTLKLLQTEPSRRIYIWRNVHLKIASPAKQSLSVYPGKWLWCRYSDLLPTSGSESYNPERVNHTVCIHFLTKSSNYSTLNSCTTGLSNSTRRCQDKLMQMLHSLCLVTVHCLREATEMTHTHTCTHAQERMGAPHTHSAWAQRCSEAKSVSLWSSLSSTGSLCKPGVIPAWRFSGNVLAEGKEGLSRPADDRRSPVMGNQSQNGRRLNSSAKSLTHNCSSHFELHSSPFKRRPTLETTKESRWTFRIEILLWNTILPLTMSNSGYSGLTVIYPNNKCHFQNISSWSWLTFCGRNDGSWTC